jgi:hypothetical protein
MSRRYFWASICIEEDLVAVDHFSKVGVAYGGVYDEVYRTAEELLQTFHESKIAVSKAFPPGCLELDEEVKVAAAFLELTGGRRAEKLKAFYALRARAPPAAVCAARPVR